MYLVILNSADGMLNHASTIDLLLEYFGACAAQVVGEIVKLQDVPLFHKRLPRGLFSLS